MRRGDRFDPMGAVARGNENDLVEPDVIAHRFGNEKMTVMNRIEAAAEDSDIDTPSP
jgi:hypothetical protein